MGNSIGILEVTGFTPAMVALDAMEKAADIEVVQAELNDFLGTVIKIGGTVDAVSAALAAGKRVAAGFGVEPIVTLLSNPEPSALRTGILSRQERSPLLDQNVVLGEPTPSPQATSETEETPMAETPSFALGFIETQGFTAVFEAIDSACKAANVEVLAKEKLGGGYITVVIKGDVAAVTAAIETGKEKVGSLGKLIAAHVIARPSANVLALLPK
ncbi:MAG: BMC domain-containing protein [Planctomycetaceae bacterium]|nr:MAG: BMC domain-containing protein [Planctomycetaceae bacterium]